MRRLARVFFNIEKFQRRPSGALRGHASLAVRPPRRWMGICWRALLIVLLSAAVYLGFTFWETFLGERQSRLSYTGLLSNTNLEPTPAAAPFLGTPRNDYKLPKSAVRALDNKTLGFEKIFVIDLPSRFDKLDAFTLAASLTPFSFEVIAGVNGSAVPNKTLPGPWPGEDTVDTTNTPAVAAAQKGCWRAHLNAARTIVQEGLGSALIFEDDADWDINLREQLKTFAAGSRLLLATPPGKERQRKKKHRASQSPYGDGWDLLWFGHCGSKPSADDRRRLIISNDKTVPHLDHRFNVADVPPDMASRDESSRIMYHASGGTSCLYAYGLSLRGAQKALYYLSMGSTALQIDIGMDALCRDPKYGFECVGVFPQLVDVYRLHGEAAVVDTDIGDGEDRREGGKGGMYTWNIKYSIRLNSKRLVDEQEAVGQWADDGRVFEGGVEMEFVDDG